MGQDQAGMVEPHLSPKQEIEIQGARSPVLLASTVAAAVLFQPLQVLQQLQRRLLGKGPPHVGEQKNGIAVGGLAWRPADRLGFYKGRTTHILSIAIAPVQKEVTQAGGQPPQRGFRRPVATTDIGAEADGQC